MHVTYGPCSHLLRKQECIVLENGLKYQTTDAICFWWLLHCLWLSPIKEYSALPGGLWQDDYLPEPNTTLPAIRKFNSSAPIPNEAGTPIDLRTFPFWVFLSLNSLTFMLSYSTILLLIPKQRIYRIVRLSLISLSVCYIVSLTVIIPTRFWDIFWYVSIGLFLCIFLLNTSATCVAWSYKVCL